MCLCLRVVGRLEFTKYMVSDEKIVLNDWEKEKEHKSVVARLIHESWVLFFGRLVEAW